MSENQSPQAANSASQSAQDSSLDSAQVSAQSPVAENKSVKDNSAEDTQIVDTASSHQPIEEWTPAPLPGTVQTTDKTTDLKIGSKRETELLTLIHDLNDCNDVLLSRVSQLEATLENVQKTAQSETQNAQALQAQVKAQMAEQVSAVQASAQKTSQNAQQQVANVVAQLEMSEQSLQRQQLINETLQSELANAKESVSQLEHECAMGVQRHAEEAQARVKAENTIRDLRSRLQRQQRYTLQFKAALEKSLTVTARAANPQPISTKPTSFSTSYQDASDAQNTVPMPKAQRIMPWAGAITSPFEGIDPHLENLIRGASKPTCDVVHHDLEIRSSKSQEQPSIKGSELQSKVAAPNAAEMSEHTTDAVATDAVTEASVAEDKLWQDIERVIEHSSESPVIATPPETTSELAAPRLQGRAQSEAQRTEPGNATEATETADTPTLGIAEPRLNWQQNASQTPETDAIEGPAEGQSLAASEPNTAEAAANEPAQPTPPVKSELKSIVIDPYTVPVGQSPADEVGFTEPSPWGKPLAEKVKASAVEADLEDSAVSPVVNPLRPQRKLGSMSAVQLPTFKKAKAASF